MTEIADYIEQEFGRERADRFEYEMKREISEIGFLGGIFGNTHIYYRSYTIFKKPFPPSIICITLYCLPVSDVKLTVDNLPVDIKVKGYDGNTESMIVVIHSWSVLVPFLSYRSHFLPIPRWRFQILLFYSLTGLLPFFPSFPGRILC